MEVLGFKRILVAVDGSPHARAATSVAASMAARSHAGVLVTHVRSRSGVHADPHLDAEARREAVGLVNQALSEMDAAGVAASGEVRMVDGQSLIGRALVRAAEDFKADLIVVGSRGRSDLAGLVLGSVSHELLTRAAVPVLVVRSGKGRLAFAGLRRLLLAVDGSLQSDAAVPVAAALAQAYGATIIVFHVNHPTVVPEGGVFLAESRDEAVAVTTAALVELAKRGVKATAQLSWSPAPLGTAIAEAARQAGADLIVMGSRGMGELGSLLLGSTAHAVIRVADRPVLVTHNRQVEEAVR